MPRTRTAPPDKDKKVSVFSPGISKTNAVLLLLLLSAGLIQAELCPQGQWSTTGSVPCTLCDAGKYADMQGTVSCVDCTANSISADSRNKCLCNEGFAGWRGKFADTFVKSGCCSYVDWRGSENEWADPTYPNAFADFHTYCTHVRGGSTHPWHLQMCGCPDGFNAATLQCALQSSWVAQGCTACPANSNSALGTVDVSDCKCDAGFYMRDRFVSAEEL